MSNLGTIDIANTVITPEKAAIVSRLEAMKSEGWQELSSMTGVELDALQAEVDAAAVLLSYDHPHNVARQDAYGAIRQERTRRQMTQFKAQQEQQHRAGCIGRAASNIRDAMELIDTANAIRHAPAGLPALPSLDAGNATDAELAAVLSECAAAVHGLPSRAADDAAAIALLGTPAAKAISSELRAKAKAEGEQLKIARDLAAAIAAEQERRKAERAEAERSRQPEAILERIAKLEQLLASEGRGNDAL